METISVPAGQQAPDGVDWVEVRQATNGGFQFAANVAASPGDATFHDGTFPTIDIAKAEGLRWAKEQGASVVYVSVLVDE